MGRRGWLALLFGLAVIACLTLFRAADPYALVAARETTFDTFQQWRPREAPPDLPIRIIDIDEASLAELGQWPWPRSTMAIMAARLTELGAAAIAFDLLFSEPDRLSPATLTGDGPDYDTEFAAALASGPTVLSLAQGGRAAGTDLAAKSGMAMTGSDPLAMLPELGGAAPASSRRRSPWTRRCQPRTRRGRGGSPPAYALAQRRLRAPHALGRSVAGGCRRLYPRGDWRQRRRRHGRAIAHRRFPGANRSDRRHVALLSAPAARNLCPCPRSAFG